MLILLPVKNTSRDEIACMKGSKSRTETATSVKVTKSSVMAGSTILKDHMKSLAGSIPSVKLMDGKVHAEAFTVALNDRTAELCPENGFLARATKTLA